MKRIYFSILFAGSFIAAKATDLVVEEFGLFPSYSSIASAVTAASDGDRIIIKNKGGNIPWIENITVNKSLEFLSFQNDTFFIVQGNYTVVPAVGRTVSFIGMQNLMGSISGSGHSPSGIRTTVNIMNSYFTNGYIGFLLNYYDLNAVSNKILAGYIAFQHGRVIGNEINSSTFYSVYLGSDATNTGDVCQIVGNKIYNTNNSYYGIYSSTTSVFVKILNNYIKHSYRGIDFSSGYSSSSQSNQIYNNTIEGYSSSTTVYAIYINGLNAAGIVEAMNNVIDESSSSTSIGIGMAGNAGQVNLYYNHIDNSHTNPINGSATSSLNNTTNTTFVFLTDGKLNTGASAIDGGNPNQIFYDLDLTVGDAGAYGGSNTLDNYFPMFFGSARVFEVRFPKSIRQGTTLSIEADGFDR